MKKKFLAMGVTLLALGALAGCKTEKEVPLTDSEFAIVIDEIVNRVPLVIDITKGDTIPTNLFRASRNDEEVPQLKDGNNLKLITNGNIKYEDEENEIYLYPTYTISWSYWEHESLAGFTFEDKIDTFLDTKYVLATPHYPTFTVEQEENGIKPPSKAARLYATINVGSRSQKIDIDVILKPQLFVPTYTLEEVRAVAKEKDIIKVRGYVHGIYLGDYNAGGIADGEWGLGIYKIMDYTTEIKNGNLLEIIGQYKVYNGLSQVEQIKSVKVLEPASFPEIKEPKVQMFTMDDLFEALSDAWPGTPTNALFSKDNSLATFDGPFRISATKNDFSKFDTSGTSHTDVILLAKDSDDYEFEVTLSINYHMGAAEQTKIRDFLQANIDKDIYYRGALGAYSNLVLGPFEFGDCFSLEPFTVDE